MVGEDGVSDDAVARAAFPVARFERVTDINPRAPVEGDDVSAAGGGSADRSGIARYDGQSPEDAGAGIPEVGPCAVRADPVGLNQVVVDGSGIDARTMIP